MKIWDLMIKERREQSETAQLFDKTATAQRGDPEMAMVQLQYLLGGGVFSFVIEHVGDITHRMSEKFDLLKGQMNNVKDKVEKTLNVLEQGYGFEKEMQENLRSSFSFRSERGTAKHSSYEEFAEDVKKLSQNYARLHRQVPVYNEPQAHAKAAAIALGEWDFDAARLHLSWLRDLVQDRDTYENEVSQITMKEGMDNAFFLSTLKGQGPTIYPLPLEAGKYKNINSKRRGGAKLKVKIRDGNKTTANKKAKHAG